MIAPARRSSRTARPRPTHRDGFWWTVTDSLDRAEPLTTSPSAARSSLAARPREAGRRRRLSLLWWVFLANAAVLVVALLLLTFSPITIDAPIKTGQFVLLLAGFLALLALNLVLLRRVLSPLLELTNLMGSVDPDRPGRRLSGVQMRSAEGQALADAFNAMLERLETARRVAARAALAAQEAERLRVARELHDEIGQTLTAVTLQAERAADGDGASTRRELRRVAEAVRESLDEVRRIARELRPEALDDLGLVNALIALCRRVEAQEGLRVERDLQAKLPALTPDVELVTYRIAQEGLTNALRHSGAARATVSLKADPRRVALIVADDGRGMPAELPPATAGIAGMRERALLVGGRLSIESRPGEGTVVRFTVPVEDEDA
jgi:two-component system, NarL family, sensor histidine kinase UhpB